MRIGQTIIALLGIVATGFGSLHACTLLPMEEQLRLPIVRSDTPAYAELNYRKQLTRYVNGYYGSIASDLVRGEGQYLDALNALMGSPDKSCNNTYRDMLAAHVGSGALAKALWELRQPPKAPSKQE